MRPSPDKIVRKATNEQGQEVEVKPDAAGPLVAQVWRTRIDPFVQKLSFIRMYSGTLKKDESVHVSGARKNIKIGPLMAVQGHETKLIDAVSAGDIVAISKTEDMHTGTTLGMWVMPPLKFPTPMVGLAAMPKTRGDEAKLSGALHKIVEEDCHLPHRSRSANQRAGNDRHERIASDDFARAAETARQGGSRRARAENCVS